MANAPTVASGRTAFCPARSAPQKTARLAASLGWSRVLAAMTAGTGCRSTGPGLCACAS